MVELNAGATAPLNAIRQEPQLVPCANWMALEHPDVVANWPCSTSSPPATRSGTRTWPFASDRLPGEVRAHYTDQPR